MNTALIAIVITIAVIALYIFHQTGPVSFLLSIVGFIASGIVVLAVMALLVAGGVWGIILMVHAVQANDIVTGIVGAFVICACIILMYLVVFFLVLGFRK